MMQEATDFSSFQAKEDGSLILYTQILKTEKTDSSEDVAFQRVRGSVFSSVSVLNSASLKYLSMREAEFRDAHPCQLSDCLENSILLDGYSSYYLKWWIIISLQ